MGPKGLFGGLFLLIGVGFFLAGAYRLVATNTIAWNGVRVTAEITGHERSGRRGWVAVYAFKTRDGQMAYGRAGTRLFSSGNNVRALQAEEVGRKIPVIYDPADPQRSVADTFMGRWSAILMMLFVLPHLLFGIYLLRRDRKEQREDGWAQRRF